MRECGVSSGEPQYDSSNTTRNPRQHTHTQGIMRADDAVRWAHGIIVLASLPGESQ
jgi:hypothetical protein